MGQCAKYMGFLRAMDLYGGQSCPVWDEQRGMSNNGQGSSRLAWATWVHLMITAHFMISKGYIIWLCRPALQYQQRALMYLYWSHLMVQKISIRKVKIRTKGHGFCMTRAKGPILGGLCINIVSIDIIILRVIDLYDCIIHFLIISLGSLLSDEDDQWRPIVGEFTRSSLDCSDLYSLDNQTFTIWNWCYQLYDLY